MKELWRVCSRKDISICICACVSVCASAYKMGWSDYVRALVA